MRRAAGFTLVELLLAMGLFAILALALVRLVDTSLTIWERTEKDRDLFEASAAVLDLVERDVQALESGSRGDLVAEWRRFDTDRDGVPGALLPRVTLVRHASGSEWRRTAPAELDGAKEPDPRRRGLVEVRWALLPPERPEPDHEPLGVLWRGERRLGAPGTSFLDTRAFASAPSAGAMRLGLEPVVGGVLWLEPWFASQTSILTDGWRVGDELADCAASWDAHGLARPSPEVSWLNEPAAGMPAAEGTPLLPRRVRVALELERPADLRRRTRLAEDVAPEDAQLAVVDETRLPPDDAFVLVDEEWMRVRTRARGTVAVARGERGTRAAPHAAGALVHFGERFEREIVVPVVEEDWDL